jgi:Caleosin related protein
MDLNILKEKNQMNEFNERGKKALCDLFDPNEDGIIWPTNTFTALRKMGFNKISGFFLTSFCHLIFAYPLRIVAWQKEGNKLNWIPDPMMRIRLDDFQVSKFNATGRKKVSSRAF